jgi:hypothetical protein
MKINCFFGKANFFLNTFKNALKPAVFHLKWKGVRGHSANRSFLLPCHFVHWCISGWGLGGGSCSAIYRSFPCGGHVEFKVLGVRPDSRFTKCIVDKINGWLNDRMIKWLFDKMTCWQTDYLIKSVVDKMTGWQNDWLTKWPFDKMTISQKDHWTKWPFNKMTNWKND